MIFLSKALNQSTSATNEMLRNYHEDHTGILQDLSEKCQIVGEIEKAVSTTDTTSANTDALRYEANFLDVAGLWRMAQGPRLRVFAIRDRVFGVRNRRHFALGMDGQSRGHGRFNRAQRHLDGSVRWVDFLGRTESEVEEEVELPEEVHLDVDAESEDEEVHTHVEPQEPREGRFQALNNWLLTFFTNWGRKMGGADSSKSDSGIKEPLLDNQVAEGGQNDIESSSDGAVTERPGYYRTSASLNNGHFHRLSTVGEEDEPSSSTPNTPTFSGLPRIPSGH